MMVSSKHLVLAAAVALSLGNGVARADEHDHEWRDRDRHEREWRDHEWREHYYERPPVVYQAPPPAYYDPPPVVVGVPNPGLNIVVPIRIR
jgi:hypothetical protein